LKELYEVNESANEKEEKEIGIEKENGNEKEKEINGLFGQRKEMMMKQRRR